MNRKRTMEVEIVIQIFLHNQNLLNFEIQIALRTKFYAYLSMNKVHKVIKYISKGKPDLQLVLIMCRQYQNKFHFFELGCNFYI